MRIHIYPRMRHNGRTWAKPTRRPVLALALITIWATRTGRMLRAAPISELSAEELVAFWADDQLEEHPAAE
jgi:hypothetical protein